MAASPVRGHGPQQPRCVADPSAATPALMNRSCPEPNSPGHGWEPGTMIERRQAGHAGPPFRPPSRPSRLGWVLGVLALLLGSVPVSAARPSIVLVLTDDQDVASVETMPKVL